MYSKLIASIKTIFTNKKSIDLGRWKLKHNQESLELFYRNIPDPGYFSNTRNTTNTEFEAVPKPVYIRGENKR